MSDCIYVFKEGLRIFLFVLMLYVPVYIFESCRDEFRRKTIAKHRI